MVLVVVVDIVVGDVEGGGIATVMGGSMKIGLEGFCDCPSSETSIEICVCHEGLLEKKPLMVPRNSLFSS